MTTATDMLAKYLAAETAILEGKEVRFGDRILKMEDLSMVIAGRQEWEARAKLETGGVARPSVGGAGIVLANFASPQ